MILLFADKSANAETSSVTFTLSINFSNIYRWSRSCSIIQDREIAVTLKDEQYHEAFARLESGKARYRIVLDADF